MNETARASLRALGTTATICTTPPSALAEARSIVERELREVDSSCSRFRPDSELATLNRRGGTRSVGERLYEAIVVALRGAAATDGLVDPTIGRSLRLAGYDRDFELLSGRTTRIVRFVPAGGWERVELDEDRRTVTLPRGVELDLGATAKALAADRTAAAAAEATGAGILVGLGGDIATAGVPPPEGWAVRILDDHADLDERGPVVSLVGGGLATSSTTVRRWRVGAAELHHILDPRSGAPARSCWRTVSVAAATCVDANIASTAVVLLGAEGPRWLDERRLPARLVRESGEPVVVGGWPANGEAAA